MNSTASLPMSFTAIADLAACAAPKPAETISATVAPREQPGGVVELTYSEALAVSIEPAN